MASMGLPTDVLLNDVSHSPEQHHETFHPFLNRWDVDDAEGDGAIWVRGADGLWHPVLHPGVAGKVLQTTVVDPFYEFIDTPTGSGGATTLDGLSDVDVAGASDGQVLKYDSSTSQWLLGTDVSGGGGFGRDVGMRYVHPNGSDSNDGLSPATAKATAQAAVSSLPGNGGTVQLPTLSGFFMVNGTISDMGKSVVFQGYGLQSTRVRFATAFHPMFHLTGRGSGVRDLQINATNVSDQAGVGGILMQEKQEWVNNVDFWNIGAHVTGSFQPEDPDAPYAIKQMGGYYTEDSYPNEVGGSKFADWCYISNCYFFHPYRAIVLLAGMNTSLYSLKGEAGERGACIYAERAGAGRNCAIQAYDIHFVVAPNGHPGGNRDAKYLVYLRSRSSSLKHMWARFNGVRLESFDPLNAFIFCDVQGASFTANTYGGEAGAQPIINFGPSGNHNWNAVGGGNLYNHSNPSYLNASNVRFAVEQSGP